MSDVNPYTVALTNCLENLDKSFKEAAEDPSTVQFLTNMVQGRMLDHLVERIAKHYQLDDLAFEKELVTILVEVFSDELFARFREKVENNPLLVFQIAKRINEAENKEEGNISDTHCDRINRLYLAILCHHLEYNHIDDVINTINSHPKIQQLIFSAIFKKYLTWVLSSMPSSIPKPKAVPS